MAQIFRIVINYALCRFYFSADFPCCISTAKADAVYAKLARNWREYFISHHVYNQENKKLAVHTFSRMGGGRSELNSTWWQSARTDALLFREKWSFIVAAESQGHLCRIWGAAPDKKMYSDLVSHIRKQLLLSGQEFVCWTRHTALCFSTTHFYDKASVSEHLWKYEASEIIRWERASTSCSVSLKTDWFVGIALQRRKLLISLHGILVPLTAFIIITTTDVERCFRLTLVGSRREKWCSWRASIFIFH